MQRGGPVMAAPAPVSVVVNGSPVALEATELSVSPTPTSPVPHVVRVSVVPASSAVSPQSPAPVATATEADERSSSGASSGTGSDDEAPYDSDSGAEMKFHLRELEDTPSSSPDGSGVSCGRPLDVEKAILSRQGTVRGVRNLVRASIKCIADCQEGKRNYVREEEGRVVLYTTSMGVIRQTWEQCRRVRNTLQTLLVRFEERDVFMNRTHQKELMDRTGLRHVVVPQLFVEGHHLGGAETVERLNETGQLRQMLKPYKKSSVGGTCTMCGGYQYLPCPVCGGSKKSAQHRHRFSSSVIFLRCLNCDEGGLVRCQLCINGDS
ncbi:glutaredoxin domain-containing cysteine-rich protein CG31559-like [Dermacentor variabilis]|uniref:glutaredoxin domain-containing cysteine-rich protein CG31559-like n=1 Tax=Dermacentor variabilis TaxID=34621 RepID=UPI003F5B74BD